MKSIKTILLSLMLLFVLCGNVFSANKAISELTASTTVADADLFMISYYNVSVFESRKITFANLRGTLIASSISDSDTTHCPDGNSVYDALALKQNYSSVLAALAGITITVDGNNVTFPGAVITTAADGSRIIATLNNTSAPSLSANTYGWYFYGEVPYINVDGVPKPAIQKVCKTITNPSDADNMLFHIAAAGTITKISGICVGGTSAVITLQDAGADGSGSTAIDDAITMDTDGANGGTISYAIHDGDIVKLDVGTVTGVVTQLMVCYE